MKRVTLKSRVVPVGRMTLFTEDVIKDEPMYHKANEMFVKFDTEQGPITKAFFTALPDDWKPHSQVPISGALFDSRVHMLMDGWYPAIPGFHLDSVPRGDDGQPLPGTGDAECVLTFLGITPTLFIEGDLEFEYDPSETIYKQLDQAVEGWIDSGEGTVVEGEPGVLYYLDSQTVHAAQANYQGFGWRWFGRLTRNAPYGPRNEIRRQVQAYVNAGEGW